MHGPMNVRFTKAAKPNSLDHRHFMFYMIFIIIVCVHKEPFRNFSAAEI